MFCFLSENDASSVPKIRFFKKSPNLDTIIRVGIFLQKWRSLTLPNVWIFVQTDASNNPRISGMILQSRDILTIIMPDQKKTGQIIIIILQVYWITVNFEHVHGLNLIFTKSNYISRWEKFHHEVQGEFTKCEFSSPSDSRTSPSDLNITKRIRSSPSEFSPCELHQGA